MKRFLALVVSLSMLLSFLPNVTYAAEAIGGAVVNNPDPNDRLNLRDAPATTARPLGKYYNGTNVLVLKHEKNGFVKVTIGMEKGSITGYMLEEYLALDAAASSVQNACPSYVHKGSITLYEKRQLTGASVSYTDASVRVLGFTDDYWHVAILESGGIIATGFAKPGDAALIAHQGSGGQAGGQTQAVVNNPNPKDRLNLREEAGTKAASLGKYYNGTPVTVLGEGKKGWVQVKIGTLTGYMQTDYLAMGEKAAKVKCAMPLHVSKSSAFEVYASQALSGAHATYGYLQSFNVMGFTNDAWHILLKNGETGFVPAKNSFIPYTPAAINNKTANDRLNIRAGKGVDYASLGRFYNGTQLFVLDAQPGKKKWVKVMLASQETGFYLEGYVNTSYLALNEKADTVKSAAPQKTLSASDGGSVPVYTYTKDPLKNPAVSSYPNGTPVTLIGIHDDGYAFVEVGGGVVVVEAKHVK